MLGKLSWAYRRLSYSRQPQEKWDAFHENYTEIRYGGKEGRGHIVTSDDIKATTAAASPAKIAAQQAIAADARAAEEASAFGEGLGDIDLEAGISEAGDSMAAYEAQQGGGWSPGAKAKGGLIKADKGGLMKKNKRKKKSYRRGGLATPKK